MPLLSALFLTVCRGEPTAPAAAPVDGWVRVTASVAPNDIHPGQAAVITVNVGAPDTVSVTTLFVRFTGLQSDSLALPVPRPGPFSYRITYSVPNGPIAGSVTATAVARLRDSTAQATVTFTVDDDGPPQVLGFLDLSPQPGDSMRFDMTGTDAAGIAQLAYHVHGAFDAQGTLSVTGYPARASWSVRVPVPATAKLGDSVFVDVMAWDGFGNTATATVRTRAIDRTAPGVSATLSPGTYDSLFPALTPVHFLGDTVTLSLTAHDNFRLSWVGWRVGTGLADSVPVTDTSTQQVIRIPVTAGMVAYNTLDYFARDSSQNIAETGLSETFVDGPKRALHVVGTGFAYPSVDFWGYSESHGLVVGGVENQFVDMTVQPFALARAFGLTGEPMDVPLTGDTTWVSDQGGARLLAVDLFQNPGTVLRTMSILLPYGPGGVRVTSDGRAVLSGLSNTLRDPGQLAFVNLGTGAVTLRTVSGFPPYVTASGDRSVIVGYDGNGNVKAYYVAADSFSTTLALAAGTPSLDVHGDEVLIGNRLYDHDLHLMRSVAASSYDGVPSILSADGQYAYFARAPGIHKVRVADGTVVETIWMPTVVGRLVELPDRNMIVYMDALRFVLVDLGPSGILSSQRIR